MHMLHVWAGEEFPPAAESAAIPEILTSAPQPGLASGSYELGVWRRTFLQAEQVAQAVQAGEAVRVIDRPDAAAGTVLTLNANALRQQVVCYLQRDRG